jgi:hypothetical protein
MPFVSYDKTSTRRNTCGHVFCIGGIESSQISLRVVAVQVAVLVELVVLLEAALCWCRRHCNISDGAAVAKHLVDIRGGCGGDVGVGEDDSGF